MFIIGSDGSIFLTRGDTARFDIVVKNADGTVYTPVAGDTITFTAKKTAGMAALITKTGSEIVIDPEDTASLANGDYVYDVDIVLANGDKNTIIPEHKLILGVNV